MDFVSVYIREQKRYTKKELLTMFRFNDEEIEKNLLYAAYKLNHQLSRKELSEYYSQKGDTKRADLWQELYNIEYTNIIEKK